MKKARPDKRLLCQGRALLPAVPPCFTALPCALRDTLIPPATDVCPHVARYWAAGMPRRRSPRPPWPIWQPASDPAPSTPGSLCVHSCLDFHLNGLVKTGRHHTPAPAALSNGETLELWDKAPLNISLLAYASVSMSTVKRRSANAPKALNNHDAAAISIIEILNIQVALPFPKRTHRKRNRDSEGNSADTSQNRKRFTDRIDMHGAEQRRHNK